MLIQSIPAAILCIVFVLIVIVLCLIGLTLFDRWCDKKNIPNNNEVTGIIFGALSLIYSLIISFTIIAVWEDYEELNNIIEKETDKLNSIMTHSYLLPENLSELIREDVVAYCQKVVDEEWVMHQGAKKDKPDAITNLRLLVHNFNIQGKIQGNVFTLLDNNLDDISDLRRERLNHTHSHVPELVWLILIADSLVVVYLFFFFQIESKSLKRVFVSFLSGMLAMSIFLVYMLDHPFFGSTQVSNDPYKNVMYSSSNI